MPGYQGGLSRAMIAWYKKLPEATKTHVFDANANALLTTAGAISSYNDDDLLDALISIFAAIAIEDWNDNSAAAFIKDISDAIGRINEYVESKGNDQDDGRLLITIDGVQVEKTFTAEAISPLGKTAFNNLKSIFEEYKRGQRYKGDKQREGFGLGLFYVAAVVKAHHGRIQVNSDGKQGTEFIIEIPQRKKTKE